MNLNLIAPIGIAALIGLRLYLRLRRSFGRQRVRTRRMTTRIVIFSILGIALVVLASYGGIWTLGSVLAGGACGTLLGYLGLRHTRFESGPEGSFYTPHTYLGLAVTVLFLARLAYDFLLLPHGVNGAPLISIGHGASGKMPPESPLTFALSGAFIAYYVSYYLGVLRESRRPAAVAPVIGNQLE